MEWVAFLEERDAKVGESAPRRLDVRHVLVVLSQAAHLQLLRVFVKGSLGTALSFFMLKVALRVVPGGLNLMGEFLIV